MIRSLFENVVFHGISNLTWSSDNGFIAYLILNCGDVETNPGPNIPYQNFLNIINNMKLDQNVLKCMSSTNFYLEQFCQKICCFE